MDVGPRPSRRLAKAGNQSSIHHFSFGGAGACGCSKCEAPQLADQGRCARAPGRHDLLEASADVLEHTNAPRNTVGDVRIDTRMPEIKTVSNSHTLHGGRRPTLVSERVAEEIQGVWARHDLEHQLGVVD